jgi:hypothetical protein
VKVITPPDSFEPNGLTMKARRVFMAGGITDCPDWQQEYIEALKEAKGVLFNPRQKKFDVKNPLAAQNQIKWEFDHLRMAHAVSFWFPEETLCPIVLFELGAWSMSDKKIFVGCHPGYKRRYDVVMQMKLARPDVRIVQSLMEVTNQVKRWVAHVG